MITTVNKPVLVLNKHWLVVHVCSVRRAMSLLYSGMAEAVTEDYQAFDFPGWLEYSKTRVDDTEQRTIGTPNMRILAPRVIVLGRFHKSPPRNVRFNRRNLFIRDGFSCQYCRKTPPTSELTIDHVIPRSRGGRSVWENVVAACVRCNTRKGSSLPSECNMIPAVPPRRPTWLATLRVIPDEEDRRVWERFVGSAQLQTGQLQAAGGA